MKRLVILGSTGSIGVNTLNVVREFPHKFKVTALTVNKNVEELAKQVSEFKPEKVFIKDEVALEEFKKINKHPVKIFSGPSGLTDIAKDDDYDIMVSALVGFAGLAPTIEGIKLGKRIALANKETLVVAGELINKLCSVHHSEIIPVDSEHSAIFQCMVGEKKDDVEKLILTASGGPFLMKSISELQNVTVSEALDHPNWSMGNKITIDSATMMNKGLEVIEAHWLFGLPQEKIDVVVHPQSIIHSMVEFIDGSIKAQLSMPDMKLPIQYALSYPERFSSSFVETNFPKLGSLTFFEPEFEKFKCLKLAFDVLNAGGTSPCILNAANEIAVSSFLKGNIKFLDIPVLIEKALNKIENHSSPDIETIFECDTITRNYLRSLTN